MVQQLYQRRTDPTESSGGTYDVNDKSLVFSATHERFGMPITRPPQVRSKGRDTRSYSILYNDHYLTTPRRLAALLSSASKSVPGKRVAHRLKDQI